MKTPLIILALLLAGCEPAPSYPLGAKHIAEADRMCQQNGGVRYISVGLHRPA